MRPPRAESAGCSGTPREPRPHRTAGRRRARKQSGARPCPCLLRRYRFAAAACSPDPPEDAGKNKYMIAVGHCTGVVLLRLEAHSKRKVRFLLSTLHVQRLLFAALLLGGGSQQIGACTAYAPVRLCRTRQACEAGFFEETAALIVGRKL
jgi:hypothetical protein